MTGGMLASALRLAGLGTWVWDIPGDCLTWSEETHRVVGMAADAFDGTLEGFLARVHEDDRAALREVVQRAFAGASPFSYRYRLRGDDGRERLIQGDGEVQFGGDGKPLRFIGTVVDITERERERQAIHDSEERFRSLVALSSDWYWQQDCELRFTEFSGGRHANEAARNKLIGLRAWEIPDCVSVGTSWEEHQATLAARLPFRDLELRIGSGSRERFVSISGEPFHDADGRFLGYRGTGADITDRKASEERQRQLNASLRMAMRLGRIGVWSLDLPQRSIDWWAGGRVVHAQDGRVADTLERLVQRVEPAQRRELQAAMDACIVQGEAFDLEVPLLAGVNPLMWIRLIGEPHRDAAGRISRVQGTAQDITERRLAAERARELGARLAATLDSVSDAFLTLNQDGTFTYVNPEAERLLGRPRGDLLGRELFQEFPGLQGSRFEREFRRAVAAGATVEFEEFAPSLQRWLKVKAYASPQGLAVYFRDITDTHSVQQALTDSQEELRHLFENAIDGVLYTGQDGRVLRANPAACAMLGRPESDLRGTSFAALVRGGDLALARLWEQRRMTGRVTGQISLACGEGSGLPADLSSAEYAAADGSVRAFVVLRDISRRVHAEQQLLQLNIELGERVLRRTAELEAANAELKTLAHSLAHDLQSPVAAIDAFSELLEEVLPQPLPDRGAHYLGRIRAAARKTSEYAQGLLALARVSQATLSPQKVDLGAIAADLLTQMAERDGDRQVQWQVQSGMVAMGDATLLRIALDNLLGNAWKFTRDRRPARIEVACDTDAAGQKVYRVRDNGAGFDMAHAHKLFGNFQRLHTAQEFPGTGLGLANVLRIVGRHGGRVWAEGVEGEGACFYFTLAASPAGPSVK